jgi:F0F1-type ATP synthase membrane subunit c/vacuolar-type H+-ATPase subunit K
MNQPVDRPSAGTGVEAHLRVLRILWAALLTTIVVYALIAFFLLRGRDAAAEGADNPTLLAAFAVMGFAAVAASFVLKRHFYAHAAERREPSRLQTGFIFALAFCEMAALLGFVGLLVTMNRYSYALLALGALGQLLHFPRRDQLAAAYGKGLW